MPKGVYERIKEYKKIKLICQYCEKEFEVYPSNRNRKYCSDKCYQKSMIGKKRSLKTRQKISKSLKGIKKPPRSKEYRRNLSKGVQKYFSQMTKEERLERMLPARKIVGSLKVRQKQSDSAKGRFAKMTEKERTEFTLPAAKANKERFAKMTKTEKRKYLRHWFEAGLKAAAKVNKERFAKMTEKERAEYCRPWSEAGTRASQKANPSSIEKAIWEELNKLKIEYKTQVSFNRGKFIVDIYIPTQRLIIECNGDYWHNLLQSKERDKKLKEYIKNHNYKLIELWESEIRKNAKQALKNGLKDLQRQG